MLVLKVHPVTKELKVMLVQTVRTVSMDSPDNLAHRENPV